MSNKCCQYNRGKSGTSHGGGGVVNAFRPADSSLQCNDLYEIQIQIRTRQFIGNGNKKTITKCKKHKD